MDFFIKKIFDGKSDELVHSQFQKYSRGEFKDKAIIKIKSSKGKYSISTTAEYAKELVMSLAKKLGEKKTNVTGALISALDLEGFEYKEKKLAIGVRKYIIDSEMTGNQILDLCNKLDKAFFALSFKTDDSDLKIKPKSPKSAKRSSSKKEIKINFCKLKTSDENIVKNLIFDYEGDFKEAIVNHTFIINDIVISDELKNEKDFAKVRESAIRKGKIIRELSIDGETSTKEVEFEA